MSLKTAIANTLPSLKSLVKMALYARRVKLPRAAGDGIVILGNGPSLNTTLQQSAATLAKFPLMAVNFAANAAVFGSLRPCYYLMVDPVFFSSSTAENLVTLRRNLAAVTWPMTLIVPVRELKHLPEEIVSNPSVTVCGINNIGVCGWQWLENMAYGNNLGMPRPRNVLIPAIMAAMGMGYKTIYLTGADHSWMQTISVDDDNHVISVQPHFYRDSAKEQKRVDEAYRGLKLHQVVESFAIAFKSYHDVARYARVRHVDIYNSTPGSFIDAFERRPI